MSDFEQTPPEPPVNPDADSPPTKEPVSKSIMHKLGLILVILVLLQIPLFMITNVMEERQTYNVDYPKTYNGPGVKDQTIIGPVLTVPYRIETTEVRTTPAAHEKSKEESVPAKTERIATKHIGYLNFFPESLNVKGTLTPEVRDEGKFKSILYSSALNFSGVFNTADFHGKNIKDEDIQWQDAFLTLGISDLRGISKGTVLSLRDEQYKFSPGVNGVKLFDSGQHVLLRDMCKNARCPFSFTLDLKGSRELKIFPAGKENKIALQSPWNDPTFVGGFLPTEKSIARDGFKAVWEVSYFSRNLPQTWTSQDPDIKNSLAQYMIGTTLATPVDFYRTAIRAVKYGSLFIIMTFLTFFCFEFMSRLRIHEVQYLLVGLALCLFFLMLVAISEWVPFMVAYVLASVPTITQITWYTQAFSKYKNTRLWKVMAAMLFGLYVYLYVLLQLENLALLIGSIGLFIALTVLFYVTRNIDWYGERRGDVPALGDL